jgi:hypothetical protein
MNRVNGVYLFLLAIEHIVCADMFEKTHFPFKYKT